MRTAVRQDDAALDYARDAGYYARQEELLQQQLEEAKRKLAPLPLRKRVWGVVSSILVFGFTAFVFYLIGEYRAITILSNRAAEQGLPTAGVSTRTALPTPPPFSGLGGDDTSPPPDYEQAIATYNEQQAARAAEYAQEATQEAPGATGAPSADNHEAAIEAWLEGPVSTATPLPEPGEAGFVESFEQPAECSPFIGYLPNDPCIEILKQQAGED
jgi:hypothetical protein